MSAVNDGGPAFPNVPEGAGDKWSDWDTGMSLRDYMAIHASEEDLRAQAEVIRSAQLRSGGMGVLDDGWRPTARYMHADAMLKARGS